MSTEATLRVDDLRAKYPTFVYESFAWHDDEHGAIDCSFRFRVGELVFEPTCRLSFVGVVRRTPLAPAVMDNLVFHLGLAEIPSYWKATCSPHVDVRAGVLSAEQEAFWTWILTEGMGEHHYRNQTPFTEPGFVTLVSRSAPEAETPEPPGGEDRGVFRGPLRSGHVVPIGGGKDSLVSLELLASRFDDVTTLAINPPASTEEAIAIAGVAERVTVSRRLDPRLLALNEAGFLNGHTPFGVVIAFAAALAAVVLGRKHLTVSNESSSDYAPLQVEGTTINHQFGKSWVLERALHRYLAAHVATELHYFSLLRPFNELAIAQRFGTLRAFHPVFRSCNRGRKTDSWCRRCPKCLSTFLVLAPFVERAALVRLFGADVTLEPGAGALLRSLLSGDGETRPFECVATPEEIRAAFALCGNERVSPGTLDLLTQRAADHLVPAELYPVVDAALRARVEPLLGRAAVAVLGLGREGTSTVAHLLARGDVTSLIAIDDDPSATSRVPSLADGDDGDDDDAPSPVRFVSGEAAVARSASFDVVFKSPGIPPDHPVITALARRPSVLSSNTALFFEQRVGTIIGVTGTKGKSTTTSLIAHVLTAAGRDARLVGNIGTPCLDGLAGAAEDTVFCVELSSFQLEGLQASPDIAVVLGVFGDHLDRYGDMASYVAAKAAITRYQTRRDLVLYNADCPRATELAASSVGRRVPFTRARPELLGTEPGPLLGSFNNDNLWPAVHVGRLFGMEDAAIAAAIRSFRPLPGRLEDVANQDGVRFVCDIRSTAPEVTIAALEALGETGEGATFLFLGGVDRQQDYRKLLPALERSSVRHIVLFPPTGARIRTLLEGTALGARIALCEPSSMEDAIRYVYRHAPAGQSVCLLSTGAPSNGGLFTGPEDKAHQFTYWANHLRREGPSGDRRP